jgi:amidohydrolase
MNLSSSERKCILRVAETLRSKLVEIAMEIWRHPETAFKEERASRLLQGFLEDEGLEVETGLAGMKTAFHARLQCKRSRPAVGFLAEMDALPGLGHACGHNLIGTASAGAAACLRRALPELAGSVEVIGCPAEESGGGKIRLSRKGFFDHLDAALLVHPDTKTEIFKLSLALIEVKLEFFGRAAHASAEPEKGINALSAMIEAFNAVKAFQQEIPDKGRIHGIITHGGTAPNIIPERTEAVFYIRGRTIEEAKAHTRKLVACARSAAHATKARVCADVKRNQAYAPFVPNRALGRVFEKNLASMDIEIEQGPEDKGLGSTDVGNVSQRVPTISPTLKIAGLRAPCHSPGFARAAGSKPGLEMMMQATKTLALTGAVVLKDAKLRREMRREFRKAVERTK